MVGIVFCAVAVIVFAACEGDQGPAGPAGSAGPTSVVAFTHINTLGDADSPLGACIWPGTTPNTLPCVFYFGGAGTDSVNVVRNGPGDYLVQFWGSFGSFAGGGTADRHEKIVLATVTQGDGMYVIAADNPGGVGRADLISVLVKIWQSDNPATLIDRNFTVLVLR